MLEMVPHPGDSPANESSEEFAVACARLSSFARRPFPAELLAAVGDTRTHNALIEPRLLLELISCLDAHDSLALNFVLHGMRWRFELEAICRNSTAIGARPLLDNVLHVAAPGAVFKPATPAPVDARRVVTSLTPCADIVLGEDRAELWLPPTPFVAPDMRRALVAAKALGVTQLRFVARPLTLDRGDCDQLRAASFRLKPAMPHCSRQAFLQQWLEAKGGCVFEVQAISALPLRREALNVLCAALFGRAARTSIGAPVLDLRLAAPAGMLPVFRFWPTPDDFARPADSSSMEVADGAGAVVLGRDAADDTLRIGSQDRMKHVFVLGGTGAGKSTLLLNMILEDIAKGEGVMLIDPHGDLAETVRLAIPSRRKHDLVWLDVGADDLAWRLDLLAIRGENADFARNRIANQFVSLFRQMYANVPEALGPCFEQYFRATLLLLMEAQDPADRTLTRFEDVLVDDDFRAKLLHQCRNAKVRQFWLDTAAHVRGENSLENVAPYITNKMSQISANPLTAAVISGDKPAVDLRAAMDGRKIVLLRLSKGVIGDYDARFLGALFLMSLIEAALSRARVTPAARTPFRVYVDEFQTLATQSAAEMLAECRKYGLALVLANQSLSQLAGDKFNPAAVGQAALANCGSLVLFRLGLSDATLLSTMIEGVSTAELMQLGVGEMVIRRLCNGAPLPAERITGLAPPVEHHQFSEGRGS